LLGLVKYPQLNGGYGVRTGGLGVDLRSVGPGKVREIEAPEAAEPDFTGVAISQTSPSDVEGKGMELGASSRDG
jgi:hypothetical protein